MKLKSVLQCTIFNIIINIILASQGLVEFDASGTRVPHNTRIFKYRDTTLCNSSGTLNVFVKFSRDCVFICVPSPKYSTDKTGCPKTTL